MSARRPASTLTKLRTLGTADRRLVVIVTMLQIWLAASLRVAPLASVRSAALRGRRAVRLLSSSPESRVLWAVDAVGRRLGRCSSCLVRALAAEMLLSSADRPMELTIGIRRAVNGVEGHAWLTDDGRVLVGATADEYSPLVRWTGERHF